MHPSTLLTTAFLVAASLSVTSCAMNDGGDDYDTDGYDQGYQDPNPYGVPQQDGYGSNNYQEVNPPAQDPIYSAPAYESSAPAAPSGPSGPPAAIAGTHTVAKGDTLWGLSRKYGVSQDAIRAANNMPAGSTNVRLGDTLNIPAP